MIFILSGEHRGLTIFARSIREFHYAAAVTIHHEKLEATSQVPREAQRADRHSEHQRPAVEVYLSSCNIVIVCRDQRSSQKSATPRRRRAGAGSTTHRARTTLYV